MHNSKHRKRICCSLITQWYTTSLKQHFATSDCVSLWKRVWGKLGCVLQQLHRLKMQLVLGPSQTGTGTKDQPVCFVEASFEFWELTMHEHFLYSTCDLLPLDFSFHMLPCLPSKISQQPITAGIGMVEYQLMNCIPLRFTITWSAKRWQTAKIVLQGGCRMKKDNARYCR